MSQATTVLQNVVKRGEVKRLDVIAVGETEAEALKDVAAGEYKLLQGNAVKDVVVSYRVVQDVAVA